MSDFIQFLIECALTIPGRKERRPEPIKFVRIAVFIVVLVIAVAVIVTAFLEATALKPVPFSELHQRPSGGAFEIKGPTP